MTSRACQVISTMLPNTRDIPYFYGHIQWILIDNFHFHNQSGYALVGVKYSMNVKRDWSARRWRARKGGGGCAVNTGMKWCVDSIPRWYTELSHWANFWDVYVDETPFHTDWLHGAEHFLTSYYPRTCSRDYPSLVEPSNSLPCSHDPTTESFPEPEQSNPNSPTLILSVQSTYKKIYAFLSPPWVLHALSISSSLIILSAWCSLNCKSCEVPRCVIFYNYGIWSVMYIRGNSV
jgi:hypothetical protein